MRYGRLAFAAAALCAASTNFASAKPARQLGVPASLGEGSVASYADVDAAGAPRAIGAVFSAKSLDGLPAASSDGHRCFDADKNGAIDPVTECAAWHERVLPLPSELARRADMPFKWILVNWNPYGHMPPGVFDKPHFDVHFYMEPIENILAIERGTCGPELVRCDQFETARKPVPSNYLPASYIDLGLVAPAMGNHLIDPMNHNFHGEPFQRHWVYGTYDGRVIFWEEMLTRAFLLSKPSVCYPITVPEAVGVTGWYPTQSCMRHDAGRDEYTVSLEKFVRREASPPAALREVPKLAP